LGELDVSAHPWLFHLRRSASRFNATSRLKMPKLHRQQHRPDAPIKHSFVRPDGPMRFRFILNEALIVVVLLALVPYVILRGLVLRMWKGTRHG
jgi:hypothetical protein